MDSDKKSVDMLEELIASSGISGLENSAEIRLMIEITRAQALLADAQNDYMRVYPDPSEVGTGGAILMLGTHEVVKALLRLVDAWAAAMLLGHANLSDDVQVDPDVWGAGWSGDEEDE